MSVAVRARVSRQELFTAEPAERDRENPQISWIVHLVFAMKGSSTAYEQLN